MAIGREGLENLIKISKPKWKTAISRVERDRIVTRGYPQEELIENLTFPEMVYLLLKGELPSENQKIMLQSVLISFCDHGVTPPSTQVARLMASTGSPLNACVSGGLLSFGEHHAGALEKSMSVLQNSMNQINLEDSSINNIKEAAQLVVDEHQEKGMKIPGYGHRFHQEDPRPPKLLEIAVKNNCFGIHCQLALEIQDILLKSKNIKINIDGANAGILSDMGFESETGTGIFMIGRLPALVAHVNEEKNREPNFRKIFELEEIYYDGCEDRILDKKINSR
jgi:citrate synthase